MNKSNLIKRNLRYQLVYRILTVITPLLTSPYLSRVLGVENLGVFSATYAYASYFVLIAMLGVEYYGNRAVALCDSQEIRARKFWEIYNIQFLASIISITIYLTTILFASPERRLISLCQGIWIVSSGLDINWYFFGTQQFKLTVSRNIFIKAVTIAFIFIIVRDKGDLIGYILVMSLGMLISQAMMWYFLFRQIGFKAIKIKESKSHAIPMIKLFIPAIGMSVFQIMDKTMVDLFSDKVNSGCYYNADRLVNIPLGVISAMSTVMLPKVTREFRSNTREKVRELLAKSLELTISLACAIGFGLGAISFEFVPLFFGAGYELCIPLILGFIPVVILKSMEEFVRSQYLIPTGKDDIYIKAVFTAAFVNLLANYFLISKYGAFGAVLGTIIAEIIVLIVQINSVKTEINFKKLFFGHGFYFIAGIIMFFIVRCLSCIFEQDRIITVFFLVFAGMFVYLLLSQIYALANKNSIYHSYIFKIWNRGKRN